MFDHISETRLLKRSHPLFLPPFQEALFWIINLQEITEEEIELAKNFLDQDAIDKSKRLSLQEDKNREIITNSILRLLLKQTTKIGLQKIKILRTEHGKPYLLDHPVHFNLSHTKNYAFFAIHPKQPIGIDIETVQNGDNLLETAEFFLHSSEKKEIAKGIDPVDKFLSLWCAKEALLKAKGTGFLVDNIPLLELKAASDPQFDVYVSGNQEIYVHHKIVEGHKLAVCLC